MKKNILLLIISSLVLSTIQIPVVASVPADNNCIKETTNKPYDNNNDILLTSDTNSSGNRPYLSISADEAERRGIQYEVENGEIRITKYTRSDDKIVTFPEEIDGMKVTKIGQTTPPTMWVNQSGKKWPNWGMEYIQYTVFMTKEPGNGSDPQVEHINLPSTLKEIGDIAFYSCKELKDLDMPDSVTEFGSLIIGGCDNVESIKLSNNLNMNEGLNDVFFCGPKLTKIYLPKCITKLKINNSIIMTWEDGNDNRRLNVFPDIYYSGSLTDWRNIELINDMEYLGSDKRQRDEYVDVNLFSAYMHFNSSAEDFYNNVNARKTDPMNIPSDRRVITVDDISITYNAMIPFYGNKKAKPEFFDITISQNGHSYNAAKVKLNKEKNRLNITKVNGNKDLSKKIKKLTKGTNGLEVNIVPYRLRYDDPDTSVKKHGKRHATLIIKSYYGNEFKIKNKDMIIFTENEEKSLYIFRPYQDTQVFGEYWAEVPGLF